MLTFFCGNIPNSQILPTFIEIKYDNKDLQYTNIYLLQKNILALDRKNFLVILILKIIHSFHIDNKKLYEWKLELPESLISSTADTPYINIKSIEFKPLNDV